jgi:hypothetical protein
MLKNHFKGTITVCIYFMMQQAVYAQCEQHLAIRVGNTIANAQPKVKTDNSNNVWLYSEFLDTLFIDSDTLVADTINPDIILARYDADGSVLSYLHIECFNNCGVGSITTGSQNEVYINGYFTDSIKIGSTVLTSNGQEDAFLIKTDSIANLIWAYNYGNIKQEIATSITLWNDTIIYFGGIFNDSTVIDSTRLYFENGQDIFIVKADSSGDIKWVKGCTGPYADYLRQMINDEAGNLYLHGTFGTIIKFDTLYAYAQGDEDVFTAKYNASGRGLWAKATGGKYFDFYGGIALDTAGYLYTTGAFQRKGLIFGLDTLSKGKTDVFIGKLNNQGTLQYRQTGGYHFPDYAEAIDVSYNSRVYTARTFTDSTYFVLPTSSQLIASKGAKDFVIVKSNNEGIFWVKHVGGTGVDKATSVSWSNTGFIYVTGFYNGDVKFDGVDFESKGENNIFLWKTCD